MQSFMKTVQSNAIIQAVLFIVLGLVLLFVPDITLVTIVYCVGAIFAISGIVSLAAYLRESSPGYHTGGALTSAIFMLAIALIMFIFPTAVAGFFSILLGAVLILCGIANTVRSISMSGMGGSLWIVGTVISILVAIGGVVIIWNPFETTVMFVMVLGALLLVNGIANLVVELSMRKHISKN